MFVLFEQTLTTVDTKRVKYIFQERVKVHSKFFKWTVLYAQNKSKEKTIICL